MKKLLTSVVLSVFCISFANAAVFVVGKGQSIQGAIFQAVDGDVIQVGRGTFKENINLVGKKITLIGQGKRTIIRGTGTGPVLTMNSGEDENTIVDRVRIKKGKSGIGAGVFIENSNPTIQRSVIDRNNADSRASAIYISGNGVSGAGPIIRNNLIHRNRTTSRRRGSPATIEIDNSNPTIVNNTIIKNDNTAILITGNSAPFIHNNILAFNGIRKRRFRRGHGIELVNVTDNNGLDIQYNIFRRNRVAAFAEDDTDFIRVPVAEGVINVDNFANNLDEVNPRFRKLKRRRTNVRLRGSSPARNAGNPDPAFNDQDGSLNDIGLTGGPSPHSDFQEN